MRSSAYAARMNRCTASRARSSGRPIKEVPPSSGLGLARCVSPSSGTVVYVIEKQFIYLGAGSSVLSHF